MKKPRGDSKLKVLPDALQEELFQVLRRTTNAKAAAWLVADHGIETSERALSEFFSWYPRSGWLKQSATFATDLEATIRKLPELRVTAAQARQVAQAAFEIQAAQNRDPRLYAMLDKGQTSKEQLALEREKFEHSKKSDEEKGLDALAAFIKGNAEAQRLYDELKAVIKKAQR